MNQQELPALLRLEHVIDRTQLSRASLYKYMAEGRLKSLKIGRSRRVTPEALADFIASFEEAS